MTFDPATQKVTLTCEGKALEAELTRPLRAITHLGYCAVHTATAFSPVAIAGK